RAARPRGRARQTVTRMYLPGLLPALHARRRGRWAAPGGTRAVSARPVRPDVRPGLGRVADPGDDRVLLHQLCTWPGGRVLSKPGWRDRVPARSRGMATDRRQVPVVAGDGPGCRGRPGHPGRRRSRGIPGPDRRLLRPGRGGPAALARPGRW